MAADRRTVKALLIGAVLAVWALLAATTVVWGLQNEQDDIRQRVNIALMRAGLSIQEVEVKGRDVILGGAADEVQRSEAEAIVYRLEGVRSVEWSDLPNVVIITETTVPSTTTPPSTPAPADSSPAPSGAPSAGPAAPQGVAGGADVVTQGGV